MPRCNEKACPFQAEENTILCRHHRNFFAYDMTMHDRGIDMRNFLRDGRESGLDGLHLITRKPSRPPTPEERRHSMLAVYHKVLGSAGMLHAMLARLKESGHNDRSDWFGKWEACFELFQNSRYPNGIKCQICGCSDLYNYYVGMRKIWKCKLCKFEFTLARNTVFQDSHTPFPSWAKCLWYLSSETGHGAIRRVQESLECSYHTAWRVNSLLNITGEYVGLKIGYRGKYSRTSQISTVRDKLLEGREIQEPFPSHHGDGQNMLLESTT